MMKFGAAQSVRRVEDTRLLRGDGRYTDDITRPGTLVGAVLRSPHAAARITFINADAARRMPGVAAVYTGADLVADGMGHIPCAVLLVNRDGTERQDTPRPALADGAVRFVGDAVAFVVAETHEAARDAAEAIQVEYDVLPSVTDLRTAAEPGAALVWPDKPGNVGFDWETGDKAQVDALFSQAAHVTRVEIVNNRIVVSSIEARVSLAEYDPANGRWTLHTNTQGVWLLKTQLAEAIFKVEPERFRVVTNDVGGGFGMKIFLYPEQVLTCYAARKLGRPVKWTSDRSEAFMSDTHGRDNLTVGEMAIDDAGKVLALRSRNVANMGAYLSTFAPAIPTVAGSKVLASVYDFKAIYLNVVGVFTNTVPVDAYRGAGRPESNYLVERLMDAAARELGQNPMAFRRANMVQPAAMPYRSAMGEVYDSGEFGKVLDAGLKQIDYQGFEARRGAAAKRGKLRGVGMAYYLEATMGAETERAEIRFSRDGNVEVLVGTQSTGQGHETAYIQLTAAQLGVDPSRIRVLQGDSDMIPTGGGTGGARSLYSEGQAILAAADSVVDKGRLAASDALEAALSDIAFEDGAFAVVGTDRRIDILTLAARQRTRVASGEDAALLDAAEIADVKTHTFPNGCHLAEVEVDPDTGTVEVVRYTVTDDMGRLINPMIVRGQVQGGVVQGIGQALFEHTAYDPDSGQLLSGSFMDYALPRASDLPDIEVEFVEVPCKSNPLGVKGAGEAGAVGSPPAIMNAVLNALLERGVTHLDMPATSESIWKALATAKAA